MCRKFRLASLINSSHKSNSRKTSDVEVYENRPPPAGASVGPTRLVHFARRLWALMTDTHVSRSSVSQTAQAGHTWASAKNARNPPGVKHLRSFIAMTIYPLIRRRLGGDSTVRMSANGSAGPGSVLAAAAASSSSGIFHLFIKILASGNAGNSLPVSPFRRIAGQKTEGNGVPGGSLKAFCGLFTG